MHKKLAFAYFRARMNAKAMGLARGYVTEDKDLDPLVLWDLCIEETSASPDASIFKCLQLDMTGEKDALIRFIFLRPGCLGVDAMKESFENAGPCSRLIIISETYLTSRFASIVRDQKYELAEFFSSNQPFVETFRVEALQYDPTMNVEFPLVRKATEEERFYLEKLLCTAVTGSDQEEQPPAAHSSKTSDTQSKSKSNKTAAPNSKKRASDTSTSTSYNSSNTKSKSDPSLLRGLPTLAPDDPVAHWYGFVPGDLLVLCPKTATWRPDFLVVGDAAK